ncbi:MAG: SpoIID/LytB domain-containing protein [Synergistaceae bacterium]|nr:SpoIID/LytB domain-containing protein [Synergistaceae bacterium]
MRNVRDKTRHFMLSALLIFMLANCAQARDMYVRLADRPSSVTVRSDASMTLTDAANKKFDLGKSAVLTRSGSSVVVGKNSFQLPARISSAGFLGFNNRKYRGEFLLTREFVLINVVDVELYVQGVLPAEGIASWPKEYQKAQAIISRTYGLRQSLNRSSRGYDVVDNTSDQVYKGAGAETPATNAMVKETAGEVLTYENTLAFTPFHSDSGGYTATNSHVWTSNIPYLTGVREPVAYQSPNSNWTARISASQVQAALSKMGLNVGKVREIRVAATDAGGRSTTLTFVGSGSSASAKSSLFRTHVGPNVLKSTFLTGGAPMTPPAQSNPRPPSPPAPPSPPVPASNEPLTGGEETRLTYMASDGIFTSEELMDMLLNPEKRKGYLYVGIQRSGAALKKEPPPAPTPKPTPEVNMPNPPNMPPLRPAEVIREENGYFVFSGRGWGHGVGLSQWGAMAMARDGWKAERILEYYYPGTAVKRFR